MNVGMEDDAMGIVVPWLVWVLFIMSTILIMIIMLNLLIAIISEAFARIYSVSAQASYQEKATIIAENSYLIPQYRKNKFCEQNKYLLLAIDVEEETTNQNNGIEAKLDKAEEKIDHHINGLQKELVKITATLKENYDDNKKILFYLEKMNPDMKAHKFNK